jgi:hypothetical protein
MYSQLSECMYMYMLQEWFRKLAINAVMKEKVQKAN